MPNFEAIRDVEREYLVSLYELAPAVVSAKLDDIAHKKNRIVPSFARHIAADLDITL